MIDLLLNTTSGKTGLVIKGVIILGLLAACADGGGGGFGGAGS